MKLTKHSYEGKRVFVGLDVHKKKYAISVICENKLVKHWSCEADPEEVAHQLNRYFSGAEILSAYEAGFSGFSLHRILVSAGIKNIVINAASIELAKNDRVKTDKKDALKIAEHLSNGRLRGIYIPTVKEEAARSLSRGREQAVARRTVVANQIKMKLHYLGLKVSGLDTKLSNVLLKKIENLDLDPSHKFALDELISSWRQTTASIGRFDEALKEQANKDVLEKTYRSAPGVGAVTARVLSNELGDMSRFNNERELFSSTGLTPSEHSSGESVRRGHISRQGSSRIRAILIEVSWRAIASDASLREFYLRVSKGRNGKKAIVAVARKLIGRLRSCFASKTVWRDLACATNAG